MKAICLKKVLNVTLFCRLQIEIPTGDSPREEIFNKATLSNATVLSS